MSHTDDEDMIPFSRWLALGTYLRSIRSAITKSNVSLKNTTFVIGNPSADLDSFVSAVVYSYFNNKQDSNGTGNDRVYIPLLNLPKTPSSDLPRMRPEFVQAVDAATSWHDSQETAKTFSASRSSVLESVLTIQDLTTKFKSSPLCSAFDPSTSPSEPASLVLVDHNAPSIPTIKPDQISSRFNIIGCVDHHVDESATPASVSPRIIRMGIGSCTTLVVSHLRDAGLFPDPITSSSQRSEAIAFQQISTLALSAILIDTTNLKSESKTTPLDHEIVTFLTSQIFDPGLQGGVFEHPDGSNAHAASVFISRDYHRLLSEAKSNSLNELTMTEVFDRDHKHFSEPHPDKQGEWVEIGISSLVQAIPWLKEHAGSAGEFAQAIENFSKENKLDVFMFLTRPTEKGKSWGAVAFSDVGMAAIQRFEKNGEEQLGLEIWDDDKDLDEAMSEKFDDRWRIWYMTKTENTRKQAAPLLRECVKVR